MKLFHQKIIFRLSLISISCFNHPHSSKVQNDPPCTYSPGSARPSCPSWIALRESAMGREIWANAGLRLWLRLRQQVRVLKCSLWLSDYQVWYPRSTCGRWNGLQGSRMFWPLPNWWKLCCNCWSSTNTGFRVNFHHRASSNSMKNWTLAVLFRSSRFDRVTIQLLLKVGKLQ